jgi:uncharacterized protein with PQ loop repeat
VTSDYIEIIGYIYTAFEDIVYSVTSLDKVGWGHGCIYVAGIIWGIELIPQIKLILKTKNVDGISLSFFLASLTAYAIYMLGMGLLSNWGIVLAHIPSLVLTFWTLILIIKNRSK